MVRWFALTIKVTVDRSEIGVLVQNWQLSAGLTASRQEDTASQTNTQLRVFENLRVVALLVDERYEQELFQLPKVVAIAKPDPIATSPDGKWYVNLLAAFEDAIDRSREFQGTVVNLSLGPPTTQPNFFDPDEPLNRATFMADSHGIVVVVAAGNEGEHGNDTMSRWAKAPWVVSVGASDEKGKRVQGYSARGIPADPILHPTVVAFGSQEWTGVSGTSFAAPRVADIAIFLQAFALNVWQKSANRYLSFEEIKSVLPGFVRRTLEKMAVPMKAELHECGAGFVSIPNALKFLRRVDLTELKMLLPMPEIKEDAVREAKKEFREPFEALSQQLLARITIDTSYDWSRPTFVPGLRARVNGYFLSQIHHFDFANDLDSAVTPRGKVSFIDVSIYPRQQRGRRFLVGKQRDSDFPTINEALSEAREWDVINVRAGIYDESLALKSGITIVGEEGVIIRNQTKSTLSLEDVRSVTLKNLEISTLAERISAIAIYKSKDVWLSNCRIYGGGNGITATATHHLILEKCEVRGRINAAFFAFCRNISLRSGSYLVGNKFGLLLYATSAKLIGSAVTGEIGDAILYIESNVPWTRERKTTVYVEHEGTSVIRAKSVKPNQVRREDLIGKIAQLSYGLLLEYTQLIAGHVALAATSFDSVVLEPYHTESGWSDFALVKSSSKLPIKIRGLSSYREIQESIKQSLERTEYFPKTLR